MNDKRIDYVVCLASLVFSILAGMISGDLFLGGLTLLTSLLCAYFASKGRRINYILGLINYLLMAYICLINNLFGLFLFNALIFAPLQIKGVCTPLALLNSMVY